MNRHLTRKSTTLILTRAGSAVTVAAIAALSLALPASAMRPPDPDVGRAPAASSLVMTAPATVATDGLQLMQVGAGLLAGVGIGAAAVAGVGRNRRSAQLPSTV